MRTERILVRPSDVNYQAIRKACRLAKSIYNVANYRIRQTFIAEGKVISHRAVDKELKQSAHECYRGMPSAASAQRVIQVLGKDWKSFFSSIKEWRKSPDKFNGRPKLPHYAKHQKMFIVGRNGFKVQNGYVHLSGGADVLGLKPFKIICCQAQPFNQKADISIVQDIRFIPKGNCYFIEVVYKTDGSAKLVALNKSHIIGIDLGIDNLATIASNQLTVRSLNPSIINTIKTKLNYNLVAKASILLPSPLNAITGSTIVFIKYLSTLLIFAYKQIQVRSLLEKVKIGSGLLVLEKSIIKNSPLFLTQN